jgi:prepilin-type N-terminal cleavage/methylation domain-containing protein
MLSLLNQKAHFSKEQGFTLVELAVVLVIIGLLTAGILVGKTLIRQSQINSVSADTQRYIGAAQTFQQKYGALPGDMPNANSYWSGVSYGDGNGQIDTVAESFLFWQHLANAQLIQGIYTGAAGTGGSSDHVINSNCPQSRLTSSGFGVKYVGIKASDTTYYDGNYGHAFIFGGYYTNFYPAKATLTAAEAQSFDDKYDDGQPGTGSVRAWNTTATYAPTCSTNSTTYNNATAGPICSLIFVTGF